MANAPRSAGSAILVAAVITLLVSVVRLIGELQGWNDTLFNRAGPGPESRQGLFGITLLIPIFGIWFGWRLRRGTGGPTHSGKAALVYVLGAAVLFGGFAGAMEAGLIVMPTPEAPGQIVGMPWAVGLVLASLLVGSIAWPRLTAMLFVYGLLARIPVIVITFLAVANDWDTHHTKLPPNVVLPAGESKAMFLSMPQGTFWIAFTVLVGGLCGCLGAAMARKQD